MRRIPLRVYIGLLIELRSRALRVESAYRTNPLSQSPGGADIVVEYTDGKVLLYDNVKMPSRYIGTMWADSMTPTALWIEPQGNNSVPVRADLIWRADIDESELSSLLRRFDVNPSGGGYEVDAESCPGCGYEVATGERPCPECGNDW